MKNSIKMTAKKKYEILVKKELSIMFNLAEEKAEEIFNKSFLPNLLKTDPSYVYHYEPKYWAKEIFNDFKTDLAS